MTTFSAHDKRQRVWAHNALMGAAGMIEVCAERIIRAETTTEQAKLIARVIKNSIGSLKAELKTRIDP